ncbi:RsiV family protein [Mycobacterium aquaticum]|uniref:DUF3298 domain-containing protein n=1 Tax=Mycobacterium aquaticum TaxID=1927124 RepID=A0A1X0ACK9_9MYCO|nr:RsiV family protein [Mycobacterium aquaticum]ORA27752.1 hypothetical protein BST13_30180 [Mycobacterium aquaticum]
MSIRGLSAALGLIVLLFGATGTAVADTGTSNGVTYTVSSTSVDPGNGWKLEVGQISGGDGAVTAAFNAASVASGKTMAGMLDRDQVLRDNATFDAKPAVSFRPTAISQVLSGVYYRTGAAHPLDYVTTVVIDSRTARPITPDDLFTDKQAGLNRLSQQTKLIFPKVYGGDAPMPDLRGNAPAEENFHNWIPTADGLEIHFEDYQFAHGQPVITVPWSQLTDVLAPDMQVLAR